MSIPVSVCGLIVVPGVEVYAWETALYHIDLSELSIPVAVANVEQQLREEALEIGVPNVKFLTSTVHQFHIERCRGLDNADIAVDSDEEVERHPIKTPHTVCGIFLDNGETYCGKWMSHGSKMAYLDVWKWARDEGRTFLLTCVHEGDVGTIPGLQLADPTCETEDEMRALMKELMASARQEE